eukprot:scaffold241145_cov28-Tisochrysis_lutea.AAC.2
MAWHALCRVRADLAAGLRHGWPPNPRSTAWVCTRSPSLQLGSAPRLAHNVIRLRQVVLLVRVWRGHSDSGGAISGGEFSEGLHCGEINGGGHA